jgi:SAM-dependent methyltransferase
VGDGGYEGDRVPSYDQFAPHFDAWQAAFGGTYDDLILPRLLATLGAHAPGAQRVADLGIGTGDLVLALARRGFAVVGVDVSRPMLAVAEAKIAAACLPTAPILLEQDIRALALASPVDAALCVYTVVNQLAGDDDLDRLFASVAGALVPGGVFVFEVNLPAAYTRFWTGDDVVSAGTARIRRRHRRLLETPLVEAAVTIEAADGGVTHDRILQRPYAEREIGDAVARAGFHLRGREVYDPFSDGGEPTKALWTVQRVRA